MLNYNGRRQGPFKASHVREHEAKQRTAQGSTQPEQSQAEESAEDIVEHLLASQGTKAIRFYFLEQHKHCQWHTKEIPT